MQILLAQPRGFCAGVERAVEVVEKTSQIVGDTNTIYVNHEIVHNSHIINYFKKKGIIFIESIEKVPDNSYFIYNAHGVPPQLTTRAHEKKLKVIDATCPLVSKVHTEVMIYLKKDYKVILIGHAKHSEVIGIIGHSKENIFLIENINDIQKLHFNEHQKLAYVTQTTLSIDDCKTIIKELEKKFPQIIGPKKSDICYATTNRQHAIKEIAKQVDIILIVGNANSSNSNRLREVAENCNVPAYRIAHANELERKWFDNYTKVGISSGASTPEILVQNAIKKIESFFSITKIETLKVLDENTTFKLPDII